MQEDTESWLENIPAGRARQGVTSHNVRYVLGFGLVGIVVAFMVVYFATW